MKTYDYQIIANLLAGKGRAEEKLESLKKFLDLHQKTYTTVEIRKFTPISEIPPNPDTKIKKGIICIGGDGTVSETIEFMVKRNWNSPIFIIPTGTANFIANSMGIRTNVSYERLLKGSLKEYDLGISESLEGKDFFLVGIGLGFEQKFLEMAKQRQKKFLGKLIYFLAAFMQLFRLTPLPYRLVLGDRELNFKSSMIIILNTKPKITSLLPLFPEKQINPNDGFLDILFIEHKNYFYSFLGILFFHILGRLDFGLVKRLRSKKVGIYSNNQLKIQIDGEIKEAQSLKISIIPHGVRFLV